MMRQVRASLGLEQLTFKQIRYFQAIAEAGSFSPGGGSFGGHAAYIDSADRDA